MSCTACTMQRCRHEAAIAQLEHAGFHDIAEQVRTGALSPTKALYSVRLRVKGKARSKPKAAPKPKPKPAPPANENAPDLGPPTETECVLQYDGNRTWIDIEATALERLDAQQGDPVHVVCELDGPKIGPRQQVTLVGMMGTNRTQAPKKGELPKPALGRIWLTDAFDFDPVVSVTLKRRRLV